MKYLLLACSLFLGKVNAIELDMYLGLNQGNVSNYSVTGLIAGVQVNNYFGIESRLMAGNETDEGTLQLLGSLLLKVSVPINESTTFDLFGGLSGANKTFEKQYTPTGYCSQECNDAALSNTAGIGITMKVNDSISVRVETIKYIKADEYSLSGHSISIVKRF